MFLRLSVHASSCLRLQRYPCRHLVVRQSAYSSSAQGRYDQATSSAAVEPPVAARSRERHEDHSQIRSWRDEFPPEQDNRVKELPLTDDDTPKYYSNIHSFNGLLREQTYRPLSIESLGKKTEILLLNSVRNPDIPPLNARIAVSPATKLSPLEFDAIVHGREPSEAPEVFDAIQQHMPADEILTSADFDNHVKNLIRLFNADQLAAFVKVQLSTRSPTREKHISPLITDPVSKPNGLAIVKKSPWRAAAQAKRAANRSDSIGSIDWAPVERSKRATKALGAAIKIMRVIWKRRVDEEAYATGSVELALTPNQWALLRSGGADHVLADIRSGNFYRNTRLERTSDETLRITGPRIEVDSICSLISSAYEFAAAIDVDLRSLQSEQLLALRVDQNLVDIMHATKTHITTTSRRTSLTIMAFDRAAKENALRRVVTLLTGTQQGRILVANDMVSTCIDVPMFSGSILPSSSRLHGLVRKAAQQTDNERRPQFRFGADVKLQQVICKKVRHAVEVQQEICRPSSASMQSKSYWQSQLTPMPCEATLGYLLHGPSITKYRPSRLRKEGTEDKLENVKCTWHTFASQPPNLAKVLPLFKRADQTLPVLEDLRIKLIPSPPLSKGRLLVSSGLPAVELILRVGDGLDPGSSTGGGIRLHAIRAIMAESGNCDLDVSCPDHVRDIKFRSRIFRHANVSEAMSDQHIAKFISAVIEGAQGSSTLQAPASVLLEAPEALQTDPAPQEYLFAGFEHRSTMMYSLNERIDGVSDILGDDLVLKLSDVKSDQSGGTRTEMTIAKRAGAIEDFEHLVDGALGVLQLIDDAHRKGSLTAQGTGKS